MEGSLICLLAGLPHAASVHIQLLVHRQEWSELQQDLLAKVNQMLTTKTEEMEQDNTLLCS